MGILDLFKGKTEQSDYSDLVKQGKLEEAIVVLEKLVRIDPRETFTRIKYAETLEKAGKVDEAVNQFDEIVRIYMEEGYVTRAVAIQKKIARLKPDRGRNTSLNITEAIEEKRGKEWSEVSLPPFFTLFSKDELREILDNGVELREYGQGEEIISEGEPGSSMFAVVNGTVQVTTGGPGGTEIELAILGPGDFFGEGSLLTDKPRTATVRSMEKVELLELTKSKMDEIISRYQHVEKILNEFFEKRAEHTVEAMLSRLKEK